MARNGVRNVRRRFLFVVPPLTGHINPTVSVGAALEARGHEVAWVGHPGVLRTRLPEDAHVFPLDDQVPDALLEKTTANAHRVRGLQAFKFLWEDFLIPLARASLTDVQAAIDDYAPDVVIVDQQMLAGALVCRKQERKWAMSATTSAGVTDPLQALPKIREWMHEQLHQLQKDYGLIPVRHVDRSPHCNLVFSSRLLVGDMAEQLPDTMHFVGLAAQGRPINVPFPWEQLCKGPKVFVSLGTVNQARGKRFFDAIQEAARGQNFQVVLVAPEDMVPNPPTNVIRADFVPQVELLKKMDVVVSHGGHNTVCESLSEGLPMVVVPIKDDQPVIAQQVVDAGAGIRLRFGRITSSELRSAILDTLQNQAYREHARRLQYSLHQAGGATSAAERLEALL